MPHVIEKDNGEGQPPSFWGTTDTSAPNFYWTELKFAKNYETAEEAEAVVPTLDGTCIVVPNDVEIYEGSQTSADDNAPE